MFRTELKPDSSLHKISLDHPVLTIGSCFADAIGSRLAQNKIQALCNPFGTVYNPVSILKLLGFCISKTYPTSDSYGQKDEVFFNYLLHSSLSSLDSKDLIARIEDKINEVHGFLASCKWVVISLGTAWAYHRVDNDEIVANCHKIPADQFKKILLSRKRILKALDQFYQQLGQYNPEARVILTVSPVRHLRDSLELNQVSKATLRLACHSAEQEYDRIQYFPSYELVMDDLRDYRFYAQDMIHPSIEAEDYIWQKFTHAYFDNRALEFLKIWKDIKNSLDHRPFHVSATKHQEFLMKTLTKLESLDYPIDVSDEIDRIKSQLS